MAELWEMPSEMLLSVVLLCDYSKGSAVRYPESDRPGG